MAELNSKDAGEFIDFMFDSILESIEKKADEDQDKYAIMMSLSQLLASKALCERSAYDCPYEVFRDVNKLSTNVLGAIAEFAHMEEHNHE